MASTGGRTVLNCNIDNSNAPRNWIRVDGRPLSARAYQTHSVLVIEITTAADAGVYRCYEQRPDGVDTLIVETEIIVNGMFFFKRDQYICAHLVCVIPSINV